MGGQTIRYCHLSCKLKYAEALLMTRSCLYWPKSGGLCPPCPPFSYPLFYCRSKIEWSFKMLILKITLHQVLNNESTGHFACFLRLYNVCSLCCVHVRLCMKNITEHFNPVMTVYETIYENKYCILVAGFNN